MTAFYQQMYVCEFKVRANAEQRRAIDEAIRTAQFIRNKCLRLWMDVHGTGKAEMSAYCAVLAKEFSFAKDLNSMARQASAERAWAAVSRFYGNCKQGIRPVGYLKFKKDGRSVESNWIGRRTGKLLHRFQWSQRAQSSVSEGKRKAIKAAPAAGVAQAEGVV